MRACVCARVIRKYVYVYMHAYVRVLQDLVGIDALIRGERERGGGRGGERGGERERGTYRDVRGGGNQQEYCSASRLLSEPFRLEKSAARVTTGMRSDEQTCDAVKYTIDALTSILFVTM